MAAMLFMYCSLQIQVGVEINVCGYVMALILVVGFREYAI